MTQPKTNKISSLAKWLAAGMSLLMFAYGVFIIVTQHYYGRTTKLGGAEVSADGLPAILMGLGFIIIGLTPMSLWAKSANAAGFWAATCLILGFLLLIFPPLLLQ